MIWSSRERLSGPNHSAHSIAFKFFTDDWTKAAIAERQKFSALLKMLRAGLTEYIK
jgi:hypothetical protein